MADTLYSRKSVTDDMASQTGTVLARPPAENVYVITHRHDKGLWGVHVTTGNRRAQVLAFRRRHDANALASYVWTWKLKNHAWPVMVMDRQRPLSFQIFRDEPPVCPSPLVIDEVDLDWLLGRMALSWGGLNLVEDVADDDDRRTLQSTYVDATVNVSQQIDWLNDLFRRPDARR